MQIEMLSVETGKFPKRLTPKHGWKSQSVCAIVLPNETLKSFTVLKTSNQASPSSTDAAHAHGVLSGEVCVNTRYGQSK